MPKCGSTFFTAVLTEYPGFRGVRLIPARGHREQELCNIRLSRYNRQKYISALHIRNSEWTQHLIQKYGITPIVLVRNFADVVISLRDHIRNENHDGPMAYFTKRHVEMDDGKLEEALVHLGLPWSLNFYLGWKTAPNALMLDYADITTGDLAGAMLNVFARAGVTATRTEAEAAIERAKTKHVRLNVGISGRGRSLSPRAADALSSLLDCYPDFQDDPLFLRTRQTLAA
jgi:hypothetical protein